MENLKQKKNQKPLKKYWEIEEVLSFFEMPFNDLIFKSANIHREFHDPNKVQISTLLSIKTASCPEDCKYCPQSAHYNTEIKKEALMNLEDVLKAAKSAKEAGASRFCMGAAWRNLHDRDVDKICEIIKGVNDLDLESCVTLGMITKIQGEKLKEAGLDYYNHNIDTSPEYYSEVITTRTFQDRVDTINNVGLAGLKVCCGGILGMGESKKDRLSFIQALIKLPYTPDSIPINTLVKIKGTPLENVEDLDVFELVRTIATIRLLFPKTRIRLSAGRSRLTDLEQAMCFMAGANSIFFGEKLLTTPNPAMNDDNKLISKLGIISNA